MPPIDPDDSARKKGTAELLVLAQLEARPRHGYEIGMEIQRRSGGAVSFQPAALYPVLYRMEKRGWIAGKWVEGPDHRRRRDYRLTPAGRKMLAKQRQEWATFLAAVQLTAGMQDA